MVSLKGKTVVDLTAELVARVARIDGTIESGIADVYGHGWLCEETINNKDGTIEHLVGADMGAVADWSIGGLSGHMGSHIQLGVRHNDNWSGLPEGMKGIWEMPVERYFGEACVCRLDHLKGQKIRPEHLENVREGDIVLLSSCWGSGWGDTNQPELDGETAYWLAEEKKIKMLGVGVPGISWETKMDEPEPENCPTHRAMTGNNIPIVYPLSNIGSLTSDRVFFISLPLNVERMEGTWVRAIAIEDK